MSDYYAEVRAALAVCLMELREMSKLLPPKKRVLIDELKDECEYYLMGSPGSDCENPANITLFFSRMKLIEVEMLLEWKKSTSPELSKS